jgi:hypothetical protein
MTVRTGIPPTALRPGVQVVLRSAGIMSAASLSPAIDGKSFDVPELIFWAATLKVFPITIALAKSMLAMAGDERCPTHNRARKKARNRTNTTQFTIINIVGQIDILA